MASTNKSTSQENPKKPAFVALIKKNQPETSAESSPKADNNSSNQAKEQSKTQKSTKATTKAKTSTKSKSSKQTEKTTTSASQGKAQATTNPQKSRQSSAKTSPKTPSNSSTKTQSASQAQPTQKGKTQSAKAKTNNSKKPSKTRQSNSDSQAQDKPQIISLKKSQDQGTSSQANTPQLSHNQSANIQEKSSLKTFNKSSNKSPVKSSNKPENKSQKVQTTPEENTQDQSSTSQPKKPTIDPIQKILLYQNQKKQRLGISDYQDQISARDLSLSLTGIFSVAIGSLLQTLLAGSIIGIFPVTALAWLSASFAKNAFTFHRTAKDIQREEEAERKIAQLLKDTYLENGGEIYSLLDKNPLMIPDPEGYRQDYLDIGLFLPSGQFLAISVKSLKGDKDFVYIDQKTNILRYRNCHGLKKWQVNPIDELKRQMDWLCENTQISQTTFLGIVVIMAPAKLKTFEDVAYQIGEIQILELDNILIVREEDLLTLINEVISRRKV